MRLWSLDPVYLDTQGLVALWREGLLAQKVLLGETRGYRHHPQLQRFKETTNPVGAIATYLRAVADEAASRGYRFDRGKIARRRITGQLRVSRGQVAYEFEHLLAKLKRRDPPRYRHLKGLNVIKTHPLFRRVAGDVADWEVV